MSPLCLPISPPRPMWTRVGFEPTSLSTAEFLTRLYSRKALKCSNDFYGSSSTRSQIRNLSSQIYFRFAEQSLYLKLDPRGSTDFCLRYPETGAYNFGARAAGLISDQPVICYFKHIFLLRLTSCRPEGFAAHFERCVLHNSNLLKYHF